MGLRGVLRTIEGARLGFYCPGCEEMHCVDAGWTFSGDYDRPTFSPSICVTSGHFCPGFQPGEDCWCTWNVEEAAAGRGPSPFSCTRCHSYVRDGSIEFLTDSTHKLSGQTVRLSPAPWSTEDPS